jgi:hypothetical protein
MQNLPTFLPRGTHPPVSNTERQREFRRRNPGYYGRLKAKERALTKARVEAILLAQRQAAAVVSKPVLMLPAPAVVIELPGINTIPARPETTPQHEAMPIVLPDLQR